MKKDEVIYINGKFLAQTITGVQRFALENLKSINNLEYDFVVLVPSNAVIPDWLDEKKVKVISGFKGVMWEQLTLPIFLAIKAKSNILLNLCNTAPLLYGNNIVTVHDVAFFRNPSWFSKRFAMFYNFMIPRIIGNSLHVFTVSEFVKNELIDLYKTENNKISVIYNAVSDAFVNKNLPRNDSFCLVVGSIEPRKNLKLVLDYFAQRQNEKLLIVGKKSKIFSSIEINEELLSNVKFTGYVSDEELVELYNKAKVFIFPSLYEGFGIPLIEAQSCGCPVISSSNSVMPEVLRDSAIFFDPSDYNDFSAKMDYLFSKPKELSHLSELGEINVKRFDWNKSSKKIIYIINGLS